MEDYKKEIRLKARQKKIERLNRTRSLIELEHNDLSQFERIKKGLSHFVNSVAFNYCIALLIFIGVVLVFAEIFAPNDFIEKEVISLSTIINIIFLIELSLRYFVAPNKKLFFKDYWIDIISILPVFSFFHQFRILNLLRLLRIFRALLIFLRQSSWFSNDVKNGIDSFGLLFFSSCFLVLCSALALVITEKEYNPDSGIFLKNLWTSAFLFVSGEMVTGLPETASAKLIAVAITIAGMVLFAILVGTISATTAEFLKARSEVKDLNIEDLSDHIIICGWERMGGLILSEIECVPEIWNKGVVVISETIEDFLENVPVKNARRLFHVKEDYTKIDVLESVGARKANAAVVLADRGKNNNLGDQDRDARTVLAALTLEKLNPEIYTCAEILDEANQTHLRMAGVEEIISRTNITAGLFASTLVNKGVSSVISEILTHKEGTYLRKFPVPKGYVGKDFIEVFTHYKKEHDSIPFSLITKDKDGNESTVINPRKDYKLKQEDILLIVTKIE